MADLLARYMARGFIFLMACMACSMTIFFVTETHDTGPFVKLMEFGIPAWFTVNAVERWAVDRVNAQSGNAPK